MRKLIIEGEMPLHGEVTIQGAKNAAQKILPATVVFPGTYLLKNVPLIQDAQALIEILMFLGADVTFLDAHTLRINTENMTTKEIPPEVTAKSTGTFLFAGALLSRFGEAKIWHPGGDKIGKRPVTWHLTAFQKLGASISEYPAYYEVRAKKLVGNCTIPFLRPTANGTVNAVIAATYAQGQTVIENVAPEPEIANFVQFMQAVGAKVSWCGTHQICVNGVEQGLGDWRNRDDPRQKRRSDISHCLCLRSWSCHALSSQDGSSASLVRCTQAMWCTICGTRSGCKSITHAPV